MHKMVYLLESRDTNIFLIFNFIIHKYTIIFFSAYLIYHSFHNASIIIHVHNLVLNILSTSVKITKTNNLMYGDKLYFDKYL